jgi:hypothetical protein
MLENVSEQLRRVLADVRNPRYKERLKTIRNSKQALEAADFRLLFEQDTTWGLFGERQQHWNETLGVVALTHFVPHERETAKDSDDVILLLTPLHRVLYTLTALTLKESNFEDFAERPLVLPQRPRHGVEVGHYDSLLDVTCSVWLEICHAYVALAQPWSIRELYCLNVDQSRALSVWLDFDPQTCKADVRYTSIGKGLSHPLCLVLSPGEETHSQPPSTGDGPLVCVQALSFEPWVELAWVREDAVFFLLLTTGGGTYVSFHRAVHGRVRRYPLYIHAIGAPVPLATTTCAVCNKTGTAEAPLVRNDMDPEIANVYCGRKCIEQMEYIRECKLRDEHAKRRAEAARLNLPPQKGI